MSPEEVRDKLLLLRGGVIEDHQTEPGGLVLILGEAVGGVILCGSVKLLQPPLHLAQSAIGELVFLRMTGTVKIFIQSFCIHLTFAHLKKII